jgi:hypothetical protein
MKNIKPIASHPPRLATKIAAAVFGETGRTNEVISLAQKAIVQANRNGESNTLELAESLLAKYLKNQTLLPAGQGAIQQK